MIQDSKKFSYLLLGLSLFTPGISYAAIGTLKDLMKIAFDILGLVVPVIMGIAVLVFFWGIAKFILFSNDETARTEGKQTMVWGIIVLFVMFSLFAIILTLRSTFFQ